MTRDAAEELWGLTPDEVYERYLVPALFDPCAEDLVGLLCPALASTALDVACGTGVVARRLASAVEAPGKVVGVDVSFPRLALARKLLPAGVPRVEWCLADAQALPFAAGAFNLVACQQSLQFFPDKGMALQEMHRVLAPGGRIGVSVWATLEASPGYRALVEAEKRILGVAIRDAAFAFSDAGALARLLEEAGFRRVQIQHLHKLVCFPSVEIFAAASLMAGLPLLPPFWWQDTTMLKAKAAGLARAIRSTLQLSDNGRELTFPVLANVATARA